MPTTNNERPPSIGLLHEAVLARTCDSREQVQREEKASAMATRMRSRNGALKEGPSTTMDSPLYVRLDMDLC